MNLSDYEIKVLRIMSRSEFNDSEIESIISTSSFIKYDFTGVGYFLEISNDLFPVKRKVISTPYLIGKTDEFEVGFVLFLENKTLTFECFSWVDNLPEDIRNHLLKINNKN